MAASVPAVNDSTATDGSHIRTVFRISSLAVAASRSGGMPFGCGYWRLADENLL